MWFTLLFLGTAALFLAMSSGTLFHLQWAQRLPSLSDLGTADRCGGRTTAPFNARSSWLRVMKNRELKTRFATFSPSAACGSKSLSLMIDPPIAPTKSSGG